MIRRLDVRQQLEAPGTARQEQLRRLIVMAPMSDVHSLADVESTLASVKAGGDSTLKELTLERHQITLESLEVPRAERQKALAEMAPLLREALEEAHSSVVAYQHSIKPTDGLHERNGVSVRDVYRPVERAACCLPSMYAQAPLTISAAIAPARVAGVEEISLCVPPVGGGVSQLMLAAAEIADVDRVYSIGDVEAVAAMTYGTETISAVDVIAGPSDTAVSVAKRLVSNIVMVPRVSDDDADVVLIADESANSEEVAATLFSNDVADRFIVVVSWSESVANEIENAVNARNSGSGLCVLVDDAQAAMDVANAVSPRRLQIATVDPLALVPLARRADVVFTGLSTPVSAGDGFGSGNAFSVFDFMRDQRVISIDQSTLGRLTPYVNAIAEAQRQGTSS